MNKIASIEKITALNPIDGADRIEVATVLGYKTVVKKGEFAVGDYCVFHFPDCLVSENHPAHSFIKNWDGRVRTCKFKKQISQGLALPVALFNLSEIIEGEDVALQINAVKYSKPIPAQLAGQMKGYFPSWLKKTDEPNLRSYPAALMEFIGKECVITVKADGSSGTFAIKDNDDFHVCSRNVDLKEDENNSFWKIAKKYKIKDGLISLGWDTCIQGEVYGEGVQGNPLKIKGIDFAAFNLFNVSKREYYDYDQMLMICKDLGIPTVKEVWRGVFNFSLLDLIEMANKQAYENGDYAEGIVIRPVKEAYSFVLDDRLSVKLINENYALAKGE
jgi:RNA ligase (TIGR02306 family)